MKAFFTGHRYVDADIPNWHIGIKKLIDMAVKRKTKHFYSGMALGADQLAAQFLSLYRFNWTAVIPCADQDKLWFPKQQRRYKKLLKSATEQIVLYPQYSPGVMQARNLWMVKRSQLCLAIYDGREAGGTAMTVKMARSRNLPVIQFNPRTTEISIIEPPNWQLSLF